MIEIIFPFDCSILPKTYEIETQISQKMNVFSFSLPFYLNFCVENAEVVVMNETNKYLYVIKFFEICFARSFAEKPILQVKEDFGEKNQAEIENKMHEKMLELNNSMNQKKKRMMKSSDGWKRYK